MIIYEFSTWGAYKSDNGLFSITEIEVEEKPKSYIGKYCRVLKGDMDKLASHYGNRMYRLSNDAKLYIEAMIQKKAERVESLKNSLELVEKELNEWQALLEDDGKGGSFNSGLGCCTTCTFR